MRRKEVLLLGIIVCWIALCTGEEEYSYDYEAERTLSKELAEEHLFRAEKEDTCNSDEDCEKRLKCRDKEDQSGKACQCADGLGGVNCEIDEACEPKGEYQYCKGDFNGTCAYDETNRRIACTCEPPRALHPNEKRCRETCKDNADGDCKHGGTCEKNEGQYFCKCIPGFIGDKCEIVFDCTENGKYKGCEKSGGTCTHDGRQIVCTCDGKKKFDDTECKDCDCGTDGECSFKGGVKTCDCHTGFAEKNQKCEVCDCGPKGKCSFKAGEKTCACDLGFADKNGICQETCKVDVVDDCKHGGTCKEDGAHNFCECKTGLIGGKCETVVECEKGGKYEDCEGTDGECTYDDSKAEAVCKCPEGKKLHDQANICKDCDCGTGGECSFKGGVKTCDCHTGFAEKNEKCEVCNCGAKGKCSFEAGEKTCACDLGFAVKNGICQETCKVDVADDCKHGGTCKEDGAHNFCECKTGIIGGKCETVVECEKDGKYKDCKGTDGECTYDASKAEAVCKCPEGKKLHDQANICKDCDCGTDGECSFKGGVKTCDCHLGFAEKNQKCEACDCGTNGKCSFKAGVKTCDCNPGFVEKNQICEACDCGPNGQCVFKGGVKTCDCHKGFSVKNGICEECDCGSGGLCDFKDGKPNCTCHEGFKLFENKCKKCDCRPGGTCDFVSGNPTCTCNEGYEELDNKCIECNCGNGTCSLEEGQKKCDCAEGFSERNGQCEVCDCGPHGKCSFVKNVRECKCDGGYTEYKKKCVETCTEDDECKYDGKCKGKEGEKVCNCKEGTEGEKCEIITACESGKFSECEDSGGKCEFEGSKPTCKCLVGDLILDNNLDKPICRANCSAEGKDYCQNGASCKNHFCDCPEGTKGDDCGSVILCETLKCKDKAATCKYDVKKTPNAFCECNDPKYTFEGDKCVANWCKDVCTGETECEYKDEIGICKCKKERQYYDYVDKKCKEYDRCFNKSCEGDLICDNGNCVCPKNKRQNGTVCEDKDLCGEKTICFPLGKCEKGISLGYVKCLCDSESSFYNPKSGKCEDGTCFLNDVDRKTCTKPCPGKMEVRKNGICAHKKPESNCDKNCGFLGYCFKEKENEKEKETCLCDPTYAELNKTSEKCILKAGVVCPTANLDGESKCTCTGKYKQAKNGITCELRSCSDEDVQKECTDVRAAMCVDDWKGAGGTKGYQCVCPAGYVKDEKKGCIDPCNQDKSKDECSSTGQLCYIGDREKHNECRCPPTFTYDKTKQSCDLNGDNTFMIHGLPVISKKYETAGKNIDKVKLAIDISMSMKQTFANLDFVHVFSLKAENDVLFCEVWLQFKPDAPKTFNATLEVQRWKAVSVKKDNQFLLPPSLLLSSSHIDDAKEEELTLCTSSVKQSICGSGSTCENNKCSCASGFRVIDSTIKATANKRILRCEDIDECAESTHSCKDNSVCVNTLGSYYCKCNPGFKKAKGDADAMNQEECIGLCQEDTCGKGKCQLTDKKAIDCTCQSGYSGSYCNRKDENLAKAANSTKVVGAVLGTLLGIVIILIIVYIVRQRKNSYSEDFSPAPRVDNAEMSERRPMRGVTNRAFQ